MAVIDRIVSRLLESDVPLERDALTTAARDLLSEEGPLADAAAAVAAVDRLIGLGPVEPLLRQPDVSDVLVNGPQDVWIERKGTLERSRVVFRDDADIIAAVERAIAPLGLRIDRASPAVDARLPDGSRLHAVIPPASVEGPVLAVRRFTEAIADLDGLEADGAIRAEGATILRDAVGDRRNIIVAGATGAGKTTLLNVLSKEIPAEERVVTVEDAAELRLDGHVVRLEARPPNSEGAGEVSLRSLLRHALRLRPDRIVVGEVRGSEALDMVQAMSTGHDGSMSTVHANGPEEALWRIESLALGGSAGVDATTLRRQITAAVDLVAFVERRSGLRRVQSIVAVGASRVDELYSC